MDAVESESDGSDPMQLLIVNRHETRETFTRYRLQETLMLMGCRPKDAVAVTKEVFVVFDKYVATHAVTSAPAGSSSSMDPATAASTSSTTFANASNEVVSALKSSGYGDSANDAAAAIMTATEEEDSLGGDEKDDPLLEGLSSGSGSSASLALPWHYLHQCIYSSLARLDYTKPHHLLDFQVAKEITQRNQSFVVLLGGTSGTGKSTLASLLAARLRLTTVLPTDSVRHILRAFTSKAENPCAFVSTYQAGDALTQEEIDELSVATDGVMSANRLHKRKVLRGYKLQSEVVLEKLDKVLTMFEKRKQSLVVEGVHLNTDQMMELVRRHPNCVPFVIYISNELKHRERFAVRARHMTIDPQENKYIKYFDNIRIIQRHLCKHADKYLIPKIDNTNVDRSIATIQSTLIRVLRKLDRGEKIFDQNINKMVLLSREHENSIKKAWSSKGVRKAMRPLIKQKVSKRLLLRRLLAEQSTGVFGATHHGEDSSSSDEDARHADDEHNGEEEEEEDDEDEQTTVVGSLFSGTTSRDHAATAGQISASSPSQRRVFLDEIEEHAAGSSDNAKMMRSLSTAIRQAALWRASQPLSNYADWESFAPPRSPEVTFSDVIESIQASPGFPEMRQKWKFEERRKSWMAGDPSPSSPSPPLLSSSSHHHHHHHSHHHHHHHQSDELKSSSSSTTTATTSAMPFKSYSQSRTTAEAIQQLQRYHQQAPENKFAQSQRLPSSSPHHITAGPTAAAAAVGGGGGRRSRTATRRVQSLPPDALADLSSVDFDLDSISIAGPNDDDQVSLTSSQRDECISPLEQSLDDTDSHFETRRDESDRSAHRRLWHNATAMSAQANNLTASCEMEYQVANAQTGRNVCTTVCKRTVLIKRRGGLEVVSEDPPMRKALKMQEHKHEGSNGCTCSGYDACALWTRTDSVCVWLLCGQRVYVRVCSVLESSDAGKADVHRVRIETAARVSNGVLYINTMTHISYFSCSHRRDGGRIYQYNLRGGEPASMESIFAFSVRMGAISKTPRARQPVLPTPTIQQHSTASSLGKRSAVERAVRGYESPRRPLRRRINDYESPSIDPRRRPLLGVEASPATPPRRGLKIRRTLLHGDNTIATKAGADPHGSSSSNSGSTERLTSEQQQIMRLIAEKKSVFFTGSAGTGKSFLLQHILKNGRKANRRVYATATTGIAAYNIGGMTLHHFAGLDTRPNANRSDFLHQIQPKKDALMRWRDVEVLVIDEISMLDGRLFDDLEALARQLRRDTRFFGGIQLVLSGDFFQLPPVSRERNDVVLCFESAAWKRGVLDTMVLKEVFRQTNQGFVDILNAFRVGKPTDRMIAALNERCTSSAQLDWTAIHIFTHNKDVLQTNTKRLDQLGGKKFNYVSADSGKKEYLSSCPAPTTISLKKDAQVMLIKTINPSSGLVNGSRGIVQGFTPQTNLPIVRFSNGSTEIIQHEEFTVRVADTVLASRRQLPLTLAWAISIHKSQGLAFDSAVLDLSRVFEFGQAYVALSRVRSLEGLRLRTRLRASDLILADSKVLDFYERIDEEEHFY